MKKINNKGFTLIEVLAVIVIIAILGLIAIPSVLNTINTGNQTAYNILVDDIRIAGQQLFEELEYAGSTLNHYDNNGELEKIVITTENDTEVETVKKVTINLQTLVSNGFLTGINNSNKTINKNTKIILNPKNNEDIGVCQITITKKIIKNENYKTTYVFENLSESNKNCPTTEEYQK